MVDALEDNQSGAAQRGRLTSQTLWSLMGPWRDEFMPLLNAHEKKDEIVKELRKIDGGDESEFIDTYFNFDGASEDPRLECEAFWNSIEPAN